MTNARHLSITAEHHTPSDIVHAVQEVMGDIDLDPASSLKANRVVRASQIFTAEDDGLRQPWSGRVFLNPPGGKTLGKSNQKAWWFKLAAEYHAGRVTEAVFVCFSIELLQTCQVKPPPDLALPFDFPMCVPARRIRYTTAAGDVGFSPPHAGAIIYLPSRRADAVSRFRSAFEPFGRVMRAAA